MCYTTYLPDWLAEPLDDMTHDGYAMQVVEKEMK